MLEIVLLVVGQTRENNIAQKFFGTIFKRRKPVTPDSQSLASDLKPIKPAKDITDFEYPPQSSFYQEDSPNRHEE